MIKNYRLANDYLNYLNIIKGRSVHTLSEYEVDLRMFFKFLSVQRELAAYEDVVEDFSFVDADFMRSISIEDMHAFVAYCKNDRLASSQTLTRKIVSIRQFWKYLKAKAHVIENNAADELETLKRPKREPKFLTLDEAMRLLIFAEKSPRDHCIISIFLNCGLRLSELVSLDVNQVDAEGVLSVIGKGNKVRRIFLSAAVKQSIARWQEEREDYDSQCNALFITKKGTRMSSRAVQDVVAKHVKQSGIHREGITPHKLRHTSATLMYKYGRCDVKGLQVILGHEDLATTSIYYEKSA